MQHQHEHQPLNKKQRRSGRVAGQRRTVAAHRLAGLRASLVGLRLDGRNSNGHRHFGWRRRSDHGRWRHVDNAPAAPIINRERRNLGPDGALASDTGPASGAAAASHNETSDSETPDGSASDGAPSDSDASADDSADDNTESSSDEPSNDDSSTDGPTTNDHEPEPPAQDPGADTDSQTNTDEPVDTPTGPVHCAVGYVADSAGKCVTPNHACRYPLLERINGSCVDPARCVGAGLTIDGVICRYEEPTCPPGYSYGRGECRTPQFDCVHPELDFPYEQRCVHPNDCPGFSIVLNSCVFEEPNCPQGYSFTAGDCRTPLHGCVHPDLDFPQQNGCIEPARCQGALYTITGTRCDFEPPILCQAPYVVHNGKCVSPVYMCVHPNLDFAHDNGCISRLECSGPGYTRVGARCDYQSPTCLQGYVYSNGACRSPQFGCVHPDLDYQRQGGCITRADCDGDRFTIVGPRCDFELPEVTQSGPADGFQPPPPPPGDLQLRQR